ncbi:MAG: Fe-S cluster assembly ATPase SufC [Bacilli bacterium]|nr:Fe-S cluster assembly ATPase SufC [Bacilli bacterium]
MKLLEINNLHTISNDNKKEILKGLSLKINSGEVHVIMGPNGSGKTTLANTIFNNPKYSITSGNIIFDGEELNNLKPNEIAQKKIFMSFQIPVEVPGVTNAQFLKTIKSNLSDERLNLLKFSKEVRENMNKLKINPDYLNRDLNVGFSGGEKKKNEILQLLTVNPKFAILDETDSGLDVDAIKLVSKGISLYKTKENAVLIITHSTKILKYLDVDYVHILSDGKIVKSGDRSLANFIEENGYASYIK